MWSSQTLPILANDNWGHICKTIFSFSMCDMYFYVVFAYIKKCIMFPRISMHSLHTVLCNAIHRVSGLTSDSLIWKCIFFISSNLWSVSLSLLCKKKLNSMSADTVSVKQLSKQCTPQTRLHLTQ